MVLSDFLLARYKTSLEKFYATVPVDGFTEEDNHILHDVILQRWFDWDHGTDVAQLKLGKDVIKLPQSFLHLQW